jgi:hypothetical protein
MRSWLPWDFVGSCYATFEQECHSVKHLCLCAGWFLKAYLRVGRRELQSFSALLPLIAFNCFQGNQQCELHCQMSGQRQVYRRYINGHSWYIDGTLCDVEGVAFGRCVDGKCLVSCSLCVCRERKIGGGAVCVYCQRTQLVQRWHSM